MMSHRENGLMRMRSIIRAFASYMVKGSFHRAGLEAQWLGNSPRHNALGMRTMGIRTVIDVGANTGQFARYIQSILPDATILCSQPLPSPFYPIARMGGPRGIRLHLRVQPRIRGTRRYGRDV